MLLKLIRMLFILLLLSSRRELLFVVSKLLSNLDRVCKCGAAHQVSKTKKKRKLPSLILFELEFQRAMQFINVSAQQLVAATYAKCMIQFWFAAAREEIKLNMVNHRDNFNCVIGRTLVAGTSTSWWGLWFGSRELVCWMSWLMRNDNITETCVWSIIPSPRQPTD